MGFYDKRQVSMEATTATYFIDGHSPVTVQLNGALANTSTIQYNQIFFQTDQLAPGNHKLDVRYH